MKSKSKSKSKSRKSGRGRSNVWSGTISFGLLNIPVSLKTADEDKDIDLDMLDEKDLAPIKFKRVNGETGKEVPYERIVKGYKYEDGRYIILTDKDFKAANPKATQTVDIEDFVGLEEIDPMLFDKPYYIIPKENAEKGYFLLRDALRKTKKVAIAKVVIRTKQHLTAIMPRGDYLILEILRFSHNVKEVHEVNYLEDVDTKTKYNTRELKMATELIEGMSAEWDPDKYHDTYYEDLMKRIEKKAQAGEGQLIEEPETAATEPDSTNVVDLLPLLRESLAVKKVASKRRGSEHHSRSHH